MSKSKEDLRLRIEDWFTEQSDNLINHCLVKQREVDKFIFSAKKYTDLFTQIKYLEELKRGAIARWWTLWISYKPEGWRRLANVTPGAPEIRALKDLAQEVRYAWKKRPRF